jgi:hypothetical protein
MRIETRTAVKRIGGFTIAATAVAVIAVLGAVALYAQSQDNDKYSLKSPSGIAFSDFRGYEDWAVVSSARTDERLKVIVGNPTMIKAFKAGIPGNGQPFPDGSMVVKLQWTPKKSTEAPFVVDVPDVFKEAFVMEKDSKRFPKSGGWGYAVFNYDAASEKFTPDPNGPLRLRIRVPYASEGEGLHLPPVPEALNCCVLRNQVPGAAPSSDTIKHAASTFSSG